MKANENKFYVLLSSNENVLVYIGSVQIRNSSSEKLLGIKFDSKTNFKDHTGSKKASVKLNVLIRVSGCMNPDK